jgi:hypothetical protein
LNEANPRSNEQNQTKTSISPTKNLPPVSFSSINEETQPKQHFQPSPFSKNIYIAPSTQSQPNQFSSEIQAIIEKRDQTKTGVDFKFQNEQKEIVKEWKSIKIICENFSIENNQLAILKPESHTILIHPTVSSFGF